MNKNSLFKYLIILLLLIILIIIYLLLKPKDDIIFKINEETVEIVAGNSFQIDYTISEDVKITWESSDTSIATVDDTGTVYGINQGNAIISGEIGEEGNKQTIYCFVTVKPTNYGVELQDVILPEGEILVSTQKSYPLKINYVPEDAYIEKTEYIIEKNDIIKIVDNEIIGLKPGYTTLTVVVNNRINRSIPVNVTDKDIEPQIIPTIDKLLIDTIESIGVSEERKLEYKIEPNDAIIYDTLWESSNPLVATISNDGTVKGIKTGEVIITLTVNNNIKSTMKLTVKKSVESIKFDYSPKQVLKVGESYTLYPTVLPQTASNKNIIYESSNPNVLSVDNTGKIEAKTMGFATITVKSIDNSVSKKIAYTVINKTGVINSTQYIWGFSKETDVIPRRANLSFFNELASKGIGLVSNGKYIYDKYTYDINNSTLIISNSAKILMRFYYPPNTDLSSLNTFTYIGGAGDTNFGGTAKNIDTNPSMIKSSGIVILIAEGSNIKVHESNVVEATNFVKAIIKQNNRARNIIGGYSNGGPVAGNAAASGKYNKIMLYNTSFYWIDAKKNIANIEVVVYKANQDSWKGTETMISQLYTAGFRNVTIITNNTAISNSYAKYFPVINPGSAMINGHAPDNMFKANFFSYACD